MLLHTMPPDFSNSLAPLGCERGERLLAALGDDATVSIRLNDGKCDVNKIIVNDSADSVPWCPSGVYLQRKPDFTFDPLLHGGLYYVQEASSMFVAHVLRHCVHEPVRMLDLCAAPGGKTTASISALPNGSLIVANEYVRTRACVLAENIQKWGNENVIVTNNEARDFSRCGISFDVLLADVPCSGEGMFRKDSGAVAEWSTKNVENCQQLQRRIVADAWDSLRESGLLIYSTCTFNVKENEENAAWIASELGAEFVEIAIEKDWNIQPAVVGNNPAYRFLPGYTRGEGLFMTVMRKTAATQTKALRNGKGDKKKTNETVKMLPLKDADCFTVRQKGDKRIAIPLRWADVYDTIVQRLNIVSAGITVETVKGNTSIPDQSLALARCLDRSQFAQCDINEEQAINYLRREAITLPTDTPRGIVLLTYRQLPIGFVKNIGNRANNLYPQEWRIRSSYTTEHNNEIIKHYETIS